MTERKKREPLWRTHIEDTHSLYSREVEPRRFHFIAVTDMDDACGRDNEGQPPFVVELYEVDLDAISPETIASSLRSCGWEKFEDKDGSGWQQNGDVLPEDPLWIAEMCHQYGAHAPLDSWTGGRVRKEHWESSNCPRELLRAAKRRSRELDDPGERAEALMKPVNKIGSTALEYMQGDIHSAMERGVRAGDASAKLMAKIHGVKDETIAAVEAQGPRSGAAVASINLHKIPTDDPLAYSMGYMSGVAGGVLEPNREELAQAYIDGYQLGTRVRLGEEPKPEWVR